MSESIAESYTGRRALVLGASGFIGAWVCRALEHAGAKVTAVSRSRNILNASASSHLVHADLLQLDSIAPIVRSAEPHVAFNLAGYGVYPDERDEATAQRMNVDVVAALADAMATVEADGWTGARVVHAGSAAEYGAASGDLVETGPTEPTTLYGRTKLAGSQVLAKRARSLSLPAITARLFTVYGPGERGQRLVRTLIAATRTRAPIPLTAGTQQRDFVYVEDSVDGMLRLGLCDSLLGDAVNVATGKLRSVREFTEIAATALGIESNRLQFGTLPERPNEMHHLPVNVSRLRTLTGWIPAIKPDEGIRRTMAHALAD